MIYTLGFILTLFALIGIMLDKEGLRPLSYAFIPGVLLLLCGIASHSHQLSAFFAQSFIDLLFLGGAAMVFRGLSYSRSFAIPGALVALVSMTAVHSIFESKIEHTEVVNKNASFVDLRLASKGELLVEVQNNENGKRWKKWIGAQGWETRLSFHVKNGKITDLDDYYLVDIPDESQKNLGVIIEKIKASGLIDWVEPNEIIDVRLMPSENISPANRVLGVNDPSVNKQWAMEALKMDQLYDILANPTFRPKKKALVAIIDSGVDAKHEDIRANFYSINKKYDVDARGHGTHCAGIAGAVTNNGIGIASMARTNDYFQITSVKVLGAAGSGSQADIIQGMITAVDAGADVLSLSLGGMTTQSRQRAYNETVRYATSKGAIVVASAGNSNRDARGLTPVNANGVIGVSAINSQLKRASFSNKVGGLDMALAAPGENIFSTKPNNHYEAHNGTSMSAPFVSGLLGIMKSIRPSLTNKEAFKILHNTGINTKNTKDTGRLIQPAAAIKALEKESM